MEDFMMIFFITVTMLAMVKAYTSTIRPYFDEIGVPKWIRVILLIIILLVMLGNNPFKVKEAIPGDDRGADYGFMEM